MRGAFLRNLSRVILSCVLIFGLTPVSAFAFCGDEDLQAATIADDSADLTAASVNPQIPIDAMVFEDNHHSYRVYSDGQLSWEAAQRACASRGGHLATISSEAENEFVYQTLVASGSSEAYFGLYREPMSDSDDPTSWKWVTGETWSYRNWSSGEPSNTDNHEFYGMFYRGRGNQWNDGAFAANEYYSTPRYICEWDATPDYDNPSVPSDASVFENRSYKLYHETLTWDEAKAKCELYGGHLATVSTPLEQFFLESLNMDSRQNVWLGGYRDGETWKWVYDGSFVDDIKWNSGEPSSRINPDRYSYEDKIAMWSLGWNDAAGDNRDVHGFICEWEQVPSGWEVPDAPEESDDVKVYKGHTYKVINKVCNWDTAFSDCVKLGGHLATITSEGEQRFIEGINTNKKKLFVGGYAIGEGGVGQWVTGETWDTALYNELDFWGIDRFGEREPNNYQSSDESFLSVWPYKWNDLPQSPYSGDQQGYICEWDSFTSASSGFEIGKNSSSFAHSNRDNESCGFRKEINYLIRSSKLRYYLLSLCEPGEGSIIIDSMFKIPVLGKRVWGGACFGVSSTMALLYEGMIEPDVLSSSAEDEYYNIPYPYLDQSFLDMINFYQLSQYQKKSQIVTTRIGVAYGSIGIGGLTDSAGSVQRFFQGLLSNYSSGHTMLLGYTASEKNAETGKLESFGHAVLITGISYDKENETYNIEIYDCNDVTKFMTMHVSKNLDSFSHTSGNGGVLDNFNFSKLELFDISLTAEDTTLRLAAQSEGQNEAYTTVLFPMDESFSLSDSEGRALSYNGASFSGDMAVHALDTIDYGLSGEYMLEVDAADDFTLTPSDSEAEITIYNDKGYISLECQGLESASLSLTEGVVLNGTDLTYSVGASIHGTESSYENVMRVEGHATSSVSISDNGETLRVQSQEPISDAFVSLLSIDGAHSQEVTDHANDMAVSRTEMLAVEQASIAAAVVTGVTDKTYTGSAITQSPVVKLDDTNLTAGRDYTVSYRDSAGKDISDNAVVAVGSYQVVITGTGSYTDEIVVPFKVVAKSNSGQNTGGSSGVNNSNDSSSGKNSNSFSGNQNTSGASGGQNPTDSTSGQSSSTHSNNSKASTRVKSSPTEWKRLWGNVALDTMKTIVQEGFSGTGGTVVVATLDGYWDALAAAGLAGLSGAPVLMTDSGALSAQTHSELERLAPSRVFVCGGPAAISDGVCEEIAAVCGVEPQRIFGDNAVATAAQINLKAPGAVGATWSGEAFLCTSDGYWDALAAAPVAYAQRMPIFLTEADGTLSDATLAAIRACGVSKVHIAGGASAVSESVESMLGDLKGQRFAGDNAVDTSELIARFGLSRGMSADCMGVATTEGYWDALAGAALCGKKGSVLVLVSGAESSSIGSFVAENAASEFSAYVFGGEAAVSNEVLARLKSVTEV